MCGKPGDVWKDSFKEERLAYLYLFEDFSFDTPVPGQPERRWLHNASWGDRFHPRFGEHEFIEPAYFPLKFIRKDSLKLSWEVEQIVNNIDELISQAQPGQVWRCYLDESPLKVTYLGILPQGVSVKTQNPILHLVQGAEWAFSSTQLSGVGMATIFNHYFPFTLTNKVVQGHTILDNE
jgi:hypothetical protein